MVGDSKVGKKVANQTNVEPEKKSGVQTVEISLPGKTTERKPVGDRRKRPTLQGRIIENRD